MKVIDVSKRSVEGVPVATKINEIRGLSTGSDSFKVRIKMFNVQKITFNWAPGARACPKDGCGRTFADLEWKYCPYHGKALDPAERK
ncbi:MAG: hypothetical protein ACYTGX_10580 [Planctomycetota bacterium]